MACAPPPHLLLAILSKLYNRRSARSGSNRQAITGACPRKGRCVRGAVLVWAGLLAQLQRSQVRKH